MSTPPNVLAVAGLRKVYGDTVAVDEVSFTVQRNEIVGLLGPNGAGKTTTINMILSVLEPTSGTIHIEGLDLAKHRRQALETDQFRGRLRAPAGQSDGVSESAHLRHDLRRQAPVGAHRGDARDCSTSEPSATPGAASFLPASRPASASPKP